MLGRTAAACLPMYCAYTYIYYLYPIAYNYYLPTYYLGIELGVALVLTYLFCNIDLGLPITSFRQISNI